MVLVIKSVCSSSQKTLLLRKEWTLQVQRTRASWKPTEYSYLCSEHFTADSFESDSAIAASFGISKRKRLKSDAIPTIFERPAPESTGKRPATTASESVAKRRRTAFEKRERSRVSQSISI